MSDLVSLSKGQTDPGSASGKDFKVKVPSYGEAGGADELVKLSDYQESPRCTEDGHGSKGGPVPEDRSKHIAKNFPVSVNKGESSDAPGKLSAMRTLDLKTGQLSPNVEKAKK